ncbi:hypothetical protein BRARA_B02593 [Brassica rapa]|uniref:Uncharacterized protein n=1 Tax=Brassica campestris TaxID=3711 RepID=A0A398AG07_BRACM|nr:hypothetical protein BRARA_B02593 [Brassica rapa]
MHRAITIIHYHLTEELRDLYLHVEDPCALWLQLRQMFKPVLLQKANDQWETIRFTDFKSVDEYNSALMDIVDGLILCDEIITNEDLIYKTYSTFHPEDVQLINKAKKFTIYEDLLSYLLASEQRKQKIILVTIDKADKLLKRIRELRERVYKCLCHLVFNQIIWLYAIWSLSSRILFRSLSALSMVTRIRDIIFPLHKRTGLKLS